LKSRSFTTAIPVTTGVRKQRSQATPAGGRLDARPFEIPQALLNFPNASSALTENKGRAMRRPPLTPSLAFAMLVLVGQSVLAADDCDAPAESWQPRSAVHALAQRNGWQVEKLKIDDGCYEIKGRDAEGRRIKAKLDPATLQVVEMKREQGGREREREREGKRAPLSPKSPASVPATGLYESASKSRRG
jgi:hypothetical protein